MARDTQVNLERLREVFGAQAKVWGRLVRDRRRSLGLTQQQFADLIRRDFPIQTVSKIERGEIAPRDYLRAAIALRLGQSIDDLFPYPSRDDLAKAAK